MRLRDSNPIPDLSRDVIVELHIVAVVGGEQPHADGAWSVWIGPAVVRRTDSRHDALEEGVRRATSLKRPLWLCEDGKRYKVLQSNTPDGATPRASHRTTHR